MRWAVLLAVSAVLWAAWAVPVGAEVKEGREIAAELVERFRSWGYDYARFLTPEGDELLLCLDPEGTCRKSGFTEACEPLTPLSAVEDDALGVAHGEAKHLGRRMLITPDRLRSQEPLRASRVRLDPDPRAPRATYVRPQQEYTGTVRCPYGEDEEHIFLETPAGRYRLRPVPGRVAPDAGRLCGEHGPVTVRGDLPLGTKEQPPLFHFRSVVAASGLRVEAVETEDAGWKVGTVIKAELVDRYGAWGYDYAEFLTAEGEEIILTTDVAAYCGENPSEEKCREMTPETAFEDEVPGYGSGEDKNLGRQMLISVERLKPFWGVTASRVGLDPDPQAPRNVHILTYQRIRGKIRCPEDTGSKEIFLVTEQGARIPLIHRTGGSLPDFWQLCTIPRTLTLEGDVLLESAEKNLFRVDDRRSGYLQ